MNTYIGTPWNTEMPTRTQDYRFCPNCNQTTKMDITAYSDMEYWTCPHCKAHSEHAPDHGRYGHSVHHTRTVKQDRTKRAHDFKRDEDRRYLTPKRRRELGIDD